MAYDARNAKYSASTPQRPSLTGYAGHYQQQNTTDENRNESNLCGSKELCPQQRQSSATQTVQKVDAATMTDPLQIDFRLTSEYLARCSSTLGLPYVAKYEDCDTTASTTARRRCQEVRPKRDFEIEPQHINGESLRALLRTPQQPLFSLTRHSRFLHRCMTTSRRDRCERYFSPSISPSRLARDNTA